MLVTGANELVSGAVKMKYITKSGDPTMEIVTKNIYCYRKNKIKKITCDNEKGMKTF